MWLIKQVRSVAFLLPSILSLMSWNLKINLMTSGFSGPTYQGMRGEMSREISPCKVPSTWVARETPQREIAFTLANQSTTRICRGRFVSLNCVTVRKIFLQPPFSEHDFPLSNQKPYKYCDFFLLRPRYHLSIQIISTCTLLAHYRWWAEPIKITVYPTK